VPYEPVGQEVHDVDDVAAIVARYLPAEPATPHEGGFIRIIVSFIDEN
jgi:hypothetical protein